MALLYHGVRLGLFRPMREGSAVVSGRVLFLGTPFFAFGNYCASGQSMNVGSNGSVSASQVCVGGDPAVLAPLQVFSTDFLPFFPLFPLQFRW